MNIIKEAQTAVNFASYYPLLNKATSDNATPCPGYIFEEIINLSHLSLGHCHHLVDFLVSRLGVSSDVGKQKIINVMRHLVQKGSATFRCQLREKDSMLRSIVGPSLNLMHQSDYNSSDMHQPSGGSNSYTVVNAKTPQLILITAVQELLAELFNSEKIRNDEGRRNIFDDSPSHTSTTMTGMGVSTRGGGSTSKYQGFGSSTTTETPVIDKVRGLLDRVLWPNIKEPSPTAKAILQPDTGNYVPFHIPDECLSEIAPYLTNNHSVGSRHTMTNSTLYTSTVDSSRASLYEGATTKSSDSSGISHRSLLNDGTDRSLVGSLNVSGRAHVVGKAGGGWDEEETFISDDTNLGSSSLPLPQYLTSGSTTSNQDGNNTLSAMLSSINLNTTEICLLNSSDSLKTEINIANDNSNVVIIKEEEFLKDFLKFITKWPVSYPEFMEKCKLCSTLNSLILLQKIATYLGSDEQKSTNESNQHHVVALLTLIDVCIHDDIFSPVDVKSTMLPLLRDISENVNNDDIVKVRAKRIYIVTEKLALMCE